MIDLKRIAGAFEISVTSLASLIGYSTQGLYSAVKGKSSHNRMYEAMKELKRESDNLYRYDIEMAESKRKHRENAITELSEACGLISPVGKPDIRLIDTGRQQERIRQI